MNDEERKRTKRLRLLKRKIFSTLSARLPFSEMAPEGNEPQAVKDWEDLTSTHIEAVLETLKDQVQLKEPQRFIRTALDDLRSYAGLAELVHDETISEIMVVTHKKVYVERGGKIEVTPVKFGSEGQLLQVIQNIARPLGRPINEEFPLLDGRLPDGSRVNAVVPPAAVDGSLLTIRKFSEERLTWDDLVRKGSLNKNMATFIEAAVRGKANVIVFGQTGSGKTTMLNVLTGFIPPGDRIVTIEDTAELDLHQEHVARLEARPAGMNDAVREVTLDDLFRNCLRMRPDRIVVGECRGAEAIAMLQSMNTGHDGSMTTLHANSPRDCLSRLETMVLMGGLQLPLAAIRRQIASAIDILIQVQRYGDGTRKISNITEISGIQGDTISTQELFVFKEQGMRDGKVVGQFVTSAAGQPRFFEKLAERGIQVPAEIFMQ